MTFQFTCPIENGFVTINASYSKGWKGNQEEPPEDDEIEIKSVYYGTEDVSDIVNWETIEEYFWENKEELMNENY
jgi:hypothetical protein